VGEVVADIAKLSVGREEYYTRELATDHEAYLSGHGESPGRWYGAGAATLGLQGEASVAGYQAMFEGRHPATGELLGRPHGRIQLGSNRPKWEIIKASFGRVVALLERASSVATRSVELTQALGTLHKELPGI
jgi:hypothetical protein